MATSEPQKYVTNKIPVFWYSKNVIGMDSIPYSTTNAGIPLSPNCDTKFHIVICFLES